MRPQLRSSLTAFAATLMLGSCLLAETPDTNLVIGEHPPTTFSLPSATTGELFDLEAARGEDPVLVLFFRGTW